MTRICEKNDAKNTVKHVNYSHNRYILKKTTKTVQLHQVRFKNMFKYLVLSYTPYRHLDQVWATHRCAAATIRRHWEGILRWFSSGLTGGLLDGMNRLIQAAKSRARGYRTNTDFIAMHCCFIDFAIKNQGYAIYRWRSSNIDSNNSVTARICIPQQITNVI